MIINLYPAYFVNNIGGIAATVIFFGDCYLLNIKLIKRIGFIGILLRYDPDTL